MTGQKNWYKDYMNQAIKVEGQEETLGLPSTVYKLKPAKESDFENSKQMDEFKEPENIIEEVQQIWNQLAKRFSFSEVMAGQ